MAPKIQIYLKNTFWTKISKSSHCALPPLALLAVLAVELLGPGVDVVVAYSDRGCFVSAATTPPPKLASAAAFGVAQWSQIAKNRPKINSVSWCHITIFCKKNPTDLRNFHC